MSEERVVLTKGVHVYVGASDQCFHLELTGEVVCIFGYDGKWVLSLKLSDVDRLKLALDMAVEAAIKYAPMDSEEVEE
jgi:hypothetical protein